MNIQGLSLPDLSHKDGFNKIEDNPTPGIQLISTQPLHSIAVVNARSIQEVPVFKDQQVSCVPSQYDSLYPVVVTNNTFSDTLVYATLVSDVFHLPIGNCIAAGVVANVGSAIATSPYVSHKVMELLPNDSSRNAARSFDQLARTFIDPGYLSYYTIAWPILGVSTVPEAMCFILASALMRKGASLLLESEMCKGSIKQQAEILTATDRVLQPSLTAFLRVMRSFAPDLVASLGRSGVSNLYSYGQGKIAAHDVLPKTLFSGAVYIVATFLYYACYRVLEQAGSRSAGMYQKTAQRDGEKIQDIKADLTTFQPALHTAVQEHSDSSLEEGKPLVENASQLFSASRPRMQALSKSFEVLQSPLVSLFKDPLYRRFIELTYEFRKDPDSQNAIEAFRAIDAAELLNKVVHAADGDHLKKEQLEAYTMLLKHLGIDIPSAQASVEEIQAVQEKGINALIKLFQSHASSHHQPSTSLLTATYGDVQGYGAIE